VRRLACAVLHGLAVPARAQETREEQLAARQAEKSAQLQPFEPDTLERRLDYVERLFVASDRGMYPYIGSAYSGQGFAVGPGYRTRFANTGSIDANAVWSIRNAKAANLTVKLPQFAGPRLGLEMQAHWIDAPDVAFYGVGMDSPDVRNGLAYRSTTAGVTARLQATRFMAFGGGFDAMSLSTQSPAIGPGGGQIDPFYGRSRLFAEYDWREAARYTRRGGLYRVEWSDYRQTNGSVYSFGRLDAEVQHFVPILRENWVIALRALASSTTTPSGNTIPLALLPELGGSRTLRGYPSWRFRDRNRMLFTGEYRWTAGSFLDMALFMDAGTVAPRFGDLDFGRLTKTYGIGASLHTATSTILRVELARTPEGNSVVFAFGPSF